MRRGRETLRQHGDADRLQRRRSAAERAHRSISAVAKPWAPAAAAKRVDQQAADRREDVDVLVSVDMVGGAPIRRGEGIELTVDLDRHLVERQASAPCRADQRADARQRAGRRKVRHRAERTAERQVEVQSDVGAPTMGSQRLRRLRPVRRCRHGAGRRQRAGLERLQDAPGHAGGHRVIVGAEREGEGSRHLPAPSSDVRLLARA